MNASKTLTPLRLCALAVSSIAFVLPAASAQATAAGTAVSWGCGMSADVGQCTVPTGLADATAVAAGSWQSLALKANGTVVAWGCGGTTDFGQCSVPSGLAGVTALSAGYGQSLALKAAGTVVAWG
jgi:hypothetical protein